MIPVLEGMCRFESLIDGSLGLADIALMNDALAVRADNGEIVRKAMERNRV